MSSVSSFYTFFENGCSLMQCNHKHSSLLWADIAGSSPLKNSWHSTGKFESAPQWYFTKAKGAAGGLNFIVVVVTNHQFWDAYITKARIATIAMKWGMVMEP